VTIQRFSDQFASKLMAEPEQPKKETVRIELPLPPATKAPESTVKPRETVRIQLPVRETAGPPTPSSPQSAGEDISVHELFPAAEATNCVEAVICFGASSFGFTTSGPEKGNRSDSSYG
jgi:hypothetical protein